MSTTIQGQLLKYNGTDDDILHPETDIAQVVNLQTLLDAKYVKPATGIPASDLAETYIQTSAKGVANGVATLGSDGLVPTAQLPSYVDDVIEAYTRSGATALASDWLSLTDGGSALTPETGKIYIILSSGSYQNKQYRWGGTTYALCNPSDVNSVNGKTGIVTLTQDDVGDGATYKQYSQTEKTKLAGIAEGATAVTESIVSGWGFTKNTGTVTSVGVKMNGTTKGTVTTSGEIDLEDVVTKISAGTGITTSTSGGEALISLDSAYKQFTEAEKTKLAGIDTGATANTITLNGTATKTPSFYAPTDAGTSGQILTSNGSGAPTWQAAPTEVKKYNATNPALTASGGAWTWTIAGTTHNVGTANMFITLYEVSTGAIVMADIVVNSSTYDVTVTIVDSASAGSLAAGTYRIALLG